MLALAARATFCLEPEGDSPFRKSLSDSIGFGCIPVLFSNLTELVAIVHAKNHDPAKVPAPEIMAYEVPAAVRKLYLEVLRLLGAAQSGEAPADWVDVPALLDQLGDRPVFSGAITQPRQHLAFS